MNNKNVKGSLSNSLALIYTVSDKIRKNTLVFVANAKIESMRYCSPS